MNPHPKPAKKSLHPSEVAEIKINRKAGHSLKVLAAHYKASARTISNAEKGRGAYADK